MDKYELLDLRNLLADKAEQLSGFELGKPGLLAAKSVMGAVDILDSVIDKTDYSGRPSRPADAMPDQVADRMRAYASEYVHSIERKFYLDAAADYLDTVSLSKEEIRDV